MKLDKNRGREIRETHSGIKEKLVCIEQNLIHKGGARKKTDGVKQDNQSIGVSIKNSSSSSTQVHLTTQKSFSSFFSLDEKCKKFIEKFCGNEKINNNGLDRFYTKEISETENFVKFLNSRKEHLVEYIIRGSKNEIIESVIWKNPKTDFTNKIFYKDIMKKIKLCNWVVLKGGIHLKNQNGKTYFHMQREGKKNKKNRYNILFHIHRNLFE